MKRKVKVLVSMIMVIGLVFGLIPEIEARAEETLPQIIVSEVTASSGEEVLVTVSVKDSPGVLGAVLRVNYDEGLELIDSEMGSVFSYLTMTKPGEYASPCQFVWDAVDQTENLSSVMNTGEFLKLLFKVSENTEPDTVLNVSVSYRDGDIIGQSLQPIDYEITNGSVTVSRGFIPGDINGDDNVNTTDVILIRRYLAGGYGVTINEDAGDVNADGKINVSDVVLMRRFLAGGYKDQNGNPLVLVAGKILKEKCSHVMKKTDYKAPTCTVDGNIAYWFCEKCSKYFRDEDGITEVSAESTVIDKTGHTVVIDPAEPPTADSYGLTEGSHCSTCGVVLVKQEPIYSNMYEIKYNIANGDSYLAKLDVDNSMNPITVNAGDSVYLHDIEVAGYNFLGWYDGAGSNAVQVKRIVDADHSMTLYAHWEKIQYTIQFKSDLVPVDSVSYTTKEGKVLPSPVLDGYTFVGWTDFDGKSYTQIKPGTIGDIVLYANWISDRNQAWSRKKLDDPMVYDDGEVILFAYEIGEIRDVPLYEIENFGKISKDGISQTVTKKYSVTTTESLMKAYAKTVENATTKSSSWTLSNGWSDEIAINEEWCKQNDITRAQAESVGKTDTGNWYVSNSSGGASSTTVADSTDTYNLTTKNNNTHSWSDDYEQRETHGWDEGRKHTTNVGIEANIGYEGIFVKAGGKATASYEYEKNSVKEGDDTTTMKGAVLDESIQTQSGTVSNHSSNSTNSSTWNTESGYGASTSTSQNKTVSSAISEMVSEKTGYGSTYINSENTSNTQGQTDYSSDSNSYSASVTYSRATSDEVEMTYTTTNTKAGYHRWVMAGTAHVFGIVGYDIASKSYFVYTYSIMDDEMHRFEDYSYNSSSFDDNQNGVIEFDIPYEISDYVNARVFASEGLEIDKYGTITDYKGDDSYVVIPDYIPIDNQDGSTTVIKVTGLSEAAFKGNESITGVKLSRYIDTIPSNAFRGCTSLWQVDAFATAVGDNAFKDCPLLSEWNVSLAITSLGKKAFDGAEELTIKAANTSVVKNAILSGAKNITIGLDKVSDSLNGMTLNIPSSVDSITLNAYGKSYDDLCIVSDSGKTTLNRMSIDSNGLIPLQLSSSEIMLNQCNITSTGITAAFTADELSLDLYGASSFNSAGPNALFCKDTSVIRSISGLATSLSLTGNIVVCGDISDNNRFIVFTEGEIIKVDSDTFDSMLKAFKLIFDPNGGECSLDSKYVDSGTMVGDLPEPTMTGYDFEGWYLQDGTKVTNSSIFSSGVDLTVIARWNVKEYTASWMGVDGVSIVVKRLNSPYKNADVGQIVSGSKIYYGDVLSISYKAQTGYSIGETGKTSITVEGNVTAEDIYATAGEISGWVLASEAPSNAVILDEKWTYDKTTNIESDKKTVEGYTLYDETYVWSSYGSWSNWSNTSVSSSESRMVETRDIAATYKTQYRYSRYYGRGSSWYLALPFASGVCSTLEYTNWLDSPLPADDDPDYTSWGRGYNENGAYVTGRNGSRYDIYWYNQETQSVQVTPAYKQYRYKDRSKIYTYYLTKTESLESNVPVNSGDGIDNVQRWVKYVVY